MRPDANAEAEAEASFSEPVMCLRHKTQPIEMFFFFTHKGSNHKIKLA
jgi:hypothetical protein